MSGCLALSGNCALPTFEPYDFDECECEGEACGGCIETTHADTFCLSGTHQEGMSEDTLIHEEVSEGESQLQSRLKTCGCGHINKAFTISGSINVCEDITKCLCDGKNGHQDSSSKTKTRTRECSDGECVPINCCTPPIVG